MNPKRGSQPVIREATENDKENILKVIRSYKEAKWDEPIAKKYFDDFFKYSELFNKDKVYVVERIALLLA